MPVRSGTALTVQRTCLGTTGRTRRNRQVDLGAVLPGEESISGERELMAKNVDPVAGGMPETLLVEEAPESSTSGQ